MRDVTFHTAPGIERKNQRESNTTEIQFSNFPEFPSILPVANFKGCGRLPGGAVVSELLPATSVLHRAGAALHSPPPAHHGEVQTAEGALYTCPHPTPPILPLSPSPCNLLHAPSPLNPPSEARSPFPTNIIRLVPRQHRMPPTGDTRCSTASLPCPPES